IVQKKVARRRLGGSRFRRRGASPGGAPVVDPGGGACGQQRGGAGSTLESGGPGSRGQGELGEQFARFVPLIAVDQGAGGAVSPKLRSDRLQGGAAFDAKAVGFQRERSHSCSKEVGFEVIGIVLHRR